MRDVSSQVVWYTGGALGSVVLSFALLGGCGGGGGASYPPPPAEYVDLYNELNGYLDTWHQSVDAGWDGQPWAGTFFAANLLAANAEAGSALLNPDYQAGVLMMLDNLKNLGCTGVTVAITYPILTDAFHSPGTAQPYHDYYVGLADEIRSRGMKVLVKHNVLLPTYSALPVADYYAALTPSQFGQERYLEELQIVQDIQPDYLTIVAEPTTWAAALGFSLTADEWKSYVDSVLAQLAIDVPSYTTLIGAGSGTWEGTSYITRFAGIAGLDYIDLHLYPCTNSIQDYLDNAVTWPVLIRSIDPTKRVVMGEAWLYKAGPSELGSGVTDPTMFGRDVWSFWQPLDIKFHKTLVNLAYYKHYDFIAPFWSRYYFAYLTYGDPTLTGLTSTQLMVKANQAAALAMMQGKVSGTGAAYKSFMSQ